MITIYTDGSYNPYTKRYGAGIVICKGNQIIKKLTCSSTKYHSARQVAGEILASVEAIAYCKENGYNTITIKHDYLGVGNWADGKWKTKQELTIKYKAFVNSYRNAGMTITFKHVKGHSNNEMNDLADKLAKEVIGLKTKK